MPVGVIDIPQQIQVSHNDREWAVKSIGTLEFVGDLLFKISMIEKPRLNIEFGLSL